MHYAQHVIKHRNKVLDDYANADVLFVQQTAKKVHCEKHRMEGFVRFQLAKDGLYYAIIQPDYNVLQKYLTGKLVKNYDPLYC